MATTRRSSDGNVALAGDAGGRVDPCVPAVAGARRLRQLGPGRQRHSYGEGKAAAADILGTAATERSPVVDVPLPNIFGEHGRPRYN